MNFLKNSASSMFGSEKYESIYKFFSEKYNNSLIELFVLSAAIGFNRNKKLKPGGRGSEFKTSLLKSEELTILYTIILSDQDIGRDILKFNDENFQREARKTLESYAEGGMAILTEEVFLQKWDGNTLDPSYEEYDVDILTYINTEVNRTPF